MQCTGGDTGKEPNYLLDCAGTCGLSRKDKDGCGICQIIGKEKNLKDCAGVCFGTAELNECGECVLGTTGKTEDAGT